MSLRTRSPLKHKVKTEVMFTPEGLGVTPGNFLLPSNFRQTRQTDDRQHNPATLALGKMGG